MIIIYGFARDQEQAIAVLDALSDACFPEEAISVVKVQRRRHRSRQAWMPGTAANVEPLGIGDPLGWFPGLDLLTAPGIGPVIASGPALALLHAGGSGGLTGLLQSMGVAAQRAQLLGRRLSYGDILIAVPVQHPGEAAEVRTVFKDRAMEDVANTVAVIPDRCPIPVQVA